MTSFHYTGDTEAQCQKGENTQNVEGRLFSLLPTPPELNSEEQQVVLDVNF